MAKKSMIEREKKRQKLVVKYEIKRQVLKQQLKEKTIDISYDHAINVHNIQINGINIGQIITTIILQKI